MDNTFIPKHILDYALAIRLYTILTELGHKSDSVLVPGILCLPNVNICHSNEPILVCELEPVIRPIDVSREDYALVCVGSSDSEVAGGCHLGRFEVADSLIKGVEVKKGVKNSSTFWRSRRVKVVLQVVDNDLRCRSRIPLPRIVADRESTRLLTCESSVKASD